MRKLSDILGTVYLTNDYIKDIEYLVHCVVNNTPCPDNIYADGIKDAVEDFIRTGLIECDLAGTRFTYKVRDTLSTLVYKYPDKIILRDSEDVERDTFLRVMRDESRIGVVETIPFPTKPADINGMSQYANSLDTSVVYNGVPYDNHPEFLVMIQLLNPDVRMVASYRSLFKYINYKFKDVIYEETEDFFYIPSDTDSFWRTHVDENGEVHIVNIGNISKADFLRKYVCIPAEIGTQSYALSWSPAWGKAVRGVMMDVKAFLGERPNTIANYFK